MPQTVVLAVGLDASLFKHQSAAWQSAGYVVSSAASIREAIVCFRDGDFDLILLGHAIPAESRERLTFLIRASGSKVPVVCVTDSCGDCDSFADATIRYEPNGNFLEGIGESLARWAPAVGEKASMRGDAG